MTTYTGTTTDYYVEDDPGPPEFWGPVQHRLLTSPMPRPWWAWLLREW